MHENLYPFVDIDASDDDDHDEIEHVDLDLQSSAEHCMQLMNSELSALYEYTLLHVCYY